MGFVLPENKNKIADDFINEKFIRKNDAGTYEITNLGALLISKDLSSFEKLSHKSVRVIWYKDNNRLDTIREKDRIEFSNAGSPLVSIERIVDTVPISRNENLAGFMHKCGICEERGSGYDKVIHATSKNSMLAPKIENQSDKFTKVTLYLKVPFDLISKEDRVRTCYMQTCFLYVNGETISNNSVRELFGIDEKDKYKASRIIKDTLEAKFIKPVDESKIYEIHSFLGLI